MPTVTKLKYLLIFLVPLLCFSHSGRTDSRGGHNDNINGGYHYHHGYPAHSHSGGCPYDYENGRSRSNYESKSKNNRSNPLIFALYIIGGIFALIFISILLGKYDKYLVKQRKLKEERLKKDNRYQAYLHLRRKQHNQNDEYIPNQLTADEKIYYKKLLLEFEQPKIQKPPETISKKSKNSRLKLLWFDLEDIIYYDWFSLKNINNIYIKILLVILLYPVYVLLMMLFLWGFWWLFTRLILLIIEGFQSINSYF